ncbi:MAG: DUF1349 domain-containing protein [Solobacterium sp.]|nr:DUF1349 domain-containing protein [Solobacterium sp.]
MTMRVSPRSLMWISKPALYIQNGDRLVLETEPYTDLSENSHSAEAIELNLSPQGNFNFTLKCEYAYRQQFDQCGLVIYSGKKRKAFFGTQYQDKETQELHCTVYYDGSGDRSKRPISASIQRMYYRIWYRAGAVRVQFSFNGGRFSDLREFRINPDDGVISIGIYACSPGNSYFDCTFSKMMLDEQA